MGEEENMKLTNGQLYITVDDERIMLGDIEKISEIPDIETSDCVEIPKMVRSKGVSIEFTIPFSYFDTRAILRNNTLRRMGASTVPYRKLFKLNPRKYALTKYNMERKYVKKKMTFDEWCKKKGIKE